MNIFNKMIDYIAGILDNNSLISPVTLSAAERGAIARGVIKAREARADKIQLSRQVSQIYANQKGLEKYANDHVVMALGEDRQFCIQSGVPLQNPAGQIKTGILYAIREHWLG